MKLALLELERERRIKERQVYMGKIHAIEQRLAEIERLVREYSRAVGPLQQGQQAETNMGCYVYGFIQAKAAREFGDIGLSVNDKPARVYSLREQDVAAVVSQHPADAKLTPLRKNLEPHHRVIRQIMETTSIVPMQFGHIAASEQEVLDALCSNQKPILEALERTDGKLEMTVKVTFGVDNVFSYFVASEPVLAAKRDQVYAASANPPTSEKIELGHLFEDLLENRREREAHRVIEALHGCASDIKKNAPRDESVLMELSLLVPKGKVHDVEENVRRVAATLPEEYVVKYTGPWAPFSFANFNLQSPVLT